MRGSARLCAVICAVLRGTARHLRGICAALRGSARDLSSSLVFGSTAHVASTALAAKRFRAYFAIIPLLELTLTCLCEVCCDNVRFVVFFVLDLLRFLPFHAHLLCFMRTNSKPLHTT